MPVELQYLTASLTFDIRFIYIHLSIYYPNCFQKFLVVDLYEVNNRLSLPYFGNMHNRIAQESGFYCACNMGVELIFIIVGNRAYPVPLFIVVDHVLNLVFNKLRAVA